MLLLHAVPSEPQLVQDLLAQGGRCWRSLPETETPKAFKICSILACPWTRCMTAILTLTSLKDSTALHVAAWKAWPETVKLLIERGANVNAQDAKGRTPLMLAVKPAWILYWTNRRSPESVEALLKARSFHRRRGLSVWLRGSGRAAAEEFAVIRAANSRE